MTEQTSSKQSVREANLEGAIVGLLDALDKQCFPNGNSLPERRCDYSLNVIDAMVKAKALLPKSETVEVGAHPRDLARPSKKGRRN